MIAYESSTKKKNHVVHCKYIQYKKICTSITYNHMAIKLENCKKENKKIIKTKIQYWMEKFHSQLSNVIQLRVLSLGMDLWEGKME